MKNKLSKITILLITIVAMLTTFAFAAKVPTIEYNGKVVKTDVDPFISEDRTFVPIRFVAETLGKKVEWNNEKRIVTITDDAKTIKLTIGNKKALVNDKEVQIDVAPLIKKDRTFVPIRFVAENFDAKIDWDNANYKVIIQDNKANLNLNSEEEKYYDEISSLQAQLSKEFDNFKKSFFDNANKLSEDELLKAYAESEKNISDISVKIKNLNAPEKFKEAQEYTIIANDKLQEILPMFKDAIITGDPNVSKKLVTELTDAQTKIQESSDALKAALKGEKYVPQEDIKVYKDEKAKQDQTGDLLNDPTLKNILDRI
ncbi:copper amine oxidase N-terminal domain-containing protein [Peptoniphilus sp.]|jgi:hypothetical protein|uniref:copper amine oxidase N-terminal domain-containing protein n=1 Tax=Peptoniphilus sp. TaxID=1971214 RepID=UPI003D94B2F4